MLGLASTSLGSAAPPDAPDTGQIVPGRVIVKSRLPNSAALRAERAGREVAAVEARPRLDAELWHVPSGSEHAIARRLAARPDVEYAEPDYVLRPMLVPNDQYYAEYQWNLPRIGAPAAWDITRGDPQIRVAVVDSGFDPGHPERPAYLDLGCDYVTWSAAGRAGDCPAVTGDPNGHGTHVAGIIAARQDNGIGVSGIAPQVTLMVLRTASAQGSSSTSDVADAIRRATDSGARVINLSLGGAFASNVLRSAVDYALARGVVIVAAAGNQFADGNPTIYPAAYPGVIAVGSTSYDDQHAWFSSTGSHLALVAPGGSATSSYESDPRLWILSLYPVLRGSYAQLEGTSQAAPHVAAVAGLMFSVQPVLTGGKVAELLLSTARPIGQPVPNPTFGYGHVDAQAAVLAAQAASLVPVPVPTVAPGFSRGFLPGAVRRASP